jgi:hypothetical protein
MKRDASGESVAGNRFIHQVRCRAITRKSESLCELSKGGGGRGHVSRASGVVLSFLHGGVTLWELL